MSIDAIYPPPITDSPYLVDPPTHAAMTERCEARARALLAGSVSEDGAVQSAAAEAIPCAGRGAQDAERRAAVASVIDVYDGKSYRLLRDLADRLGASLAYVDRATVEAHPERALSDVEWAATNDQFAAMDFDDVVGDHGRFRTEWIERVLDKAGVPGYGYTADVRPTSADRIDTKARHDPAAI